MKRLIEKFKSINIFLNSKNMLFRTVVLYCVFTFFVIYSVTAIHMHYSKEKLMGKIYESHISGLKAMQIFSDTNIAQKTNDVLLSFQVARKGRTNIKNFVSTKNKINEKEIYDIYTELVELITENSILHSVDIYNRANNMVISSNYGVVFNNDEGYGKYFDDEEPMIVEVGKDNIQMINTFSMFVPAEEKSSCSAMVLDRNVISDLLRNQLPQSNGINFYITDKNFKIIAGTNKNAWNTELDKNELRIDGVGKTTLCEEVCQVLYVPSEASDWNYVYTISTGLYSKEIKDLNKVSFWNVLSMTMLSFCGLAFISRWIYGPIAELVASLKKHFKGEQKNKSDILFISDEVKYLIRQVDDVNALNKKNEPLILSQLIMETVYGNDLTRDVLAHISALDIKFDTNIITPIIVNIDEQMFRGLDIKQQNFLVYRICEVFSATSSDETKCLASKISYNNIAAFIMAEKEKTIEVMRTVIKTMCHLGFDRINIFVGETLGEKDNPGEIFRELLSYNEYSFVYGYENVLPIEEIREREINTGKASEEIMSALNRFLENGEMEKARDFVTNLYNDCCKNKYSNKTIQKYFFDIFSMIARQQNMQKNIPKITESELGDMHRLYEYICQTFEILGGGETINSREEELVKEVKKYILENADRDVSQKTVASKFCVSTAHLSRIFKKITGEKFSDYVTETKMQAAAKMLKENPKMTVVNVAETFGYFNINYFNTLFKKQFYMTPSQYRKN